MVQEGSLPAFFAEYLHSVRLCVKTDAFIVMVLEGQVGRGQHQGIEGRVTCGHAVAMSSVPTRVCQR